MNVTQLSVSLWISAEAGIYYNMLMCDVALPIEINSVSEKCFLLWKCVCCISAVRFREEGQTTIISVSLLCGVMQVLWKKLTHSRMHLHIQSLRARSVCVDSPVCPMSCVCFVIIVLTVFLWRCAYDDSQTHKALGGCFKNTNCSTHTHTQHKYPHTHWYYLYQVTPWWWHTPYSTWHIIQTDTHTHTTCFTHLTSCCCHCIHVCHTISDLNSEQKIKNAEVVAAYGSAHRITNSNFTTFSTINKWIKYLYIRNYNDFQSGVWWKSIFFLTSLRLQPLIKSNFNSFILFF